MPPLYGVVFHDPMRQPTKKPLHDLWRLTASYPGRQSRPHLFHVVRKVCTKSGHVSTIPSVVKNNSHHGISTIKSDYPFFLYGPDSGVCRRQQGAARLYHIREFKHGLTVPRIRDCRACRGYAQYPSRAGTTGPCVKEPPLKAESQLENIQRETDDQNEFAQDGPHAQVPRG